MLPTVINNVEKVRIAKGMSKTAIAKVLGLSLQGYRHIANGAVKLGVDRLQVISNYIGVPVYIFFDDKLTESVISEIKKTA